MTTQKSKKLTATSKPKSKTKNTPKKDVKQTAYPSLEQDLKEGQLFFHMVEFKGNFMLDSRYQNWRKAISAWLADTPEGVQLTITNTETKQVEDVVVEFKLIKMKQHPQDLIRKKNVIAAERSSIPPGIQVKQIQTAPDTSFY